MDDAAARKIPNSSSNDDLNSIGVKIALCTSLDFSQFLDILVTSHDSCLESLNQKIVLSAYVPTYLFTPWI